MRYIDRSSINVPSNWIELAKSRLGNAHNSLWSFFKGPIENLVGKKCWFSESINSGADNDIEHFRPKGRYVRELKKENADLDPIVWDQLNCKSRDGYSFLAFDFFNYRYSCTFVNSPRHGNLNKVRGKSNFFPLKLNSLHAISSLTIDNEETCLLDPCNIIDPEYFTFNDLGLISPHESITYFSWECCKVMVSIEVYHLHYYRFTEARKIKWDECKNVIERVNDILSKAKVNGIVKLCLQDNIERLAKMIDIKSEYSAVAIDCIKFYKKSYSWIDRFFPAHVLKK